MMLLKFPKLNQNKQKLAGFSLIETLMAVGILGILISGWMQYMKGASVSMSSAKTRQSVMEIEHYLLAFPDCEKTMLDTTYQANCKAGNPINVFDKYGNIVISTSGRLFGDVKIESRCQDGNITFWRRFPGSPSKDFALYGGIPWYCAPPKEDEPCMQVSENLCPDKYAAISFQDSSGTPGQTGNKYRVNAQCCLVPPDLLLNDHVFVNDYCGADRVVTGAKVVGANDRQLRCTKIDTSKYGLAAEVITNFFETSPYSSNSGWQGATRVHIETTNKLSYPQKYFLLKSDNLTSNPYYPGTLTKTGATSSSHESECISPNGNGIIVGRDSKYCRSHKTKEVINKADSQVVKLFPTGCSGTFTNTTFTVTMTNVVCDWIPSFWGRYSNVSLK